MFDLKPQAIMGSKSSSSEIRPDWAGPRVNFARFSAELAARRAALGDDLPAPRNDGKRRTASKQALLEAIEKAGGKW